MKNRTENSHSCKTNHGFYLKNIFLYYMFLDIFLCRDFPGGDGVVPMFLPSPLDGGIESALLRSALDTPFANLRILAAWFHIDSFLCPDLGLASEQDFDSVSNRAVEVQTKMY